MNPIQAEGRYLAETIVALKPNDRLLAIIRSLPEEKQKKAADLLVMAIDGILSLAKGDKPVVDKTEALAALRALPFTCEHGGSGYCCWPCAVSYQQRYGYWPINAPSRTL